MPARDLYAVLGLPRSASDKEIRQAYRKLARAHHPDLNPDDRVAEERFKEISQAYEVLSDPTKRAQYDRFGHVGNARGGPGSASGFGDVGWAAAPPGMDTLIDQLLQGVGRRRPGGPKPGQTLEQTVEVTLADAMTGTTRRIQVGQAGGGSRTLEVTIQPGVSDGTRIRMAGQGGPGQGGGLPGDLYLTVKLIPHERFTRHGADLHTVIEIPYYRVALGGEVEVPTLTGGRLALTIPADTRSGQRFRLAGQGIPRMGGAGRGDLYAEVRAMVPEDLTDHERSLLRELASLRGD